MIDQAKEVAKRLRGWSNTTMNRFGHEACDTIDSLIAEVERLGLEYNFTESQRKQSLADYARMKAEIERLRAALEAKSDPGQEPVAYVKFKDGDVDYDSDAVISNTLGDCMDESIEWRPVYATPQTRQPMTDEEIDSVTFTQWGEMKGYPLEAHRAYARAIESAHGIKGGAV